MTGRPCQTILIIKRDDNQRTVTVQNIFEANWQNERNVLQARKVNKRTVGEPTTEIFENSSDEIDES